MFADDLKIYVDLDSANGLLSVQEANDAHSVWSIVEICPL